VAAGEKEQPVNPQLGIALAVGLAATVDDLRRRNISNWIVLAALAAGLVYQVSQHGVWGALYSLIGAVAGFAVFLVFYVFGGMGGGDVKLMAGFGALLGASALFEAALWTAGCGGLMALGVLAWRALVRRLRPARAGLNEKASDSIPYAPAIAVGVLLTILSRS
jgi:prepilin peptidase CpaA